MPYEKLKFLSSLYIKDKDNKPSKVYAFVSKDIDITKNNQMMRISLFDKDKHEIGCINSYLNRNVIDSREKSHSFNSGMFNKGDGTNPFIEKNQEYVYVSQMGNFFNSKNERTMTSHPDYSRKTANTSEKRYDSVGKALYGLLIKYIDSKNLSNIKGISTHAKIENGSMDFHNKLGFEKYDKILYSMDDYTDEEIEYQGMYLPRENFEKIANGLFTKPLKRV